jgi:hypothetical protein
MGLIDDTRKRRDSWISRFEEMRQEEEYEPDTRSPEVVEKEIQENCSKVGVFPDIDKVL